MGGDAMIDRNDSARRRDENKNRRGRNSRDSTSSPRARWRRRRSSARRRVRMSNRKWSLVRWRDTMGGWWSTRRRIRGCWRVRARMSDERARAATILEIERRTRAATRART